MNGNFLITNFFYLKISISKYQIVRQGKSMFKKLTNSGLLLLALSAFIAPVAVAQMEEEGAPDTRIEKYDELTETDGTTSTSDSNMMYDVRRTEAFNLVSSAYRGQYEAQGINGYAVMISNYNSGELTAEDLINAAIEAGELSPSALEDDSYVEAVELQLETLRNS